ncbi:MAG: hypothetical protein H0W72_02940 [Planctomycetes bacterium]|nr:hypothetical protein [Planctomycetota bacterium]
MSDFTTYTRDDDTLTPAMRVPAITLIGQISAAHARRRQRRRDAVVCALWLLAYGCASALLGYLVHFI